MIAKRAQTGNELAQQFEPLAGKVDRLMRQASDVAARARQTGDEAAADRVVRQRKDDGDGRCRLLWPRTPCVPS